MTNLALDLRFALRALRRSPLFSTVAILSVALGIGCNTAIFTLLDQILLRQLPVKEPDKLVMLYQRGAHNGNNMGDRMHSYPIYQDFQQKAKPFAEVLCRRLISTSVTPTSVPCAVNTTCPFAASPASTLRVLAMSVASDMEPPGVLRS